MKAFVFFITLFYLVYCKKEKVTDLYDMLNDPKILLEIEKRLNLIDDDSEPFSDRQVGCSDKSGLLAPGCRFIANRSMIIKTTESIQRGAEFLDDFVNISCPTECTALCCENKKCDTTVYQDKGDHKCFLFHCGDSGACLFSDHKDYWKSSVPGATHKSHNYIPGVATHSHENELENLGSHDKQRSTTPVPPPPTTTTRTTTSLLGLGESCSLFESECEDQHAECLGKTCVCRAGYHEKHGVCRKHCQNEEFECDRIMYGNKARQCVLNRYVCDGHADCDDGSDEMNCPDKSKQDAKLPHRPLDGDNKNRLFPSHPDKHVTEKPPSTTHKATEKVITQSTPKAVTPSPADAVKVVPTNASKSDTPKPVSQAPTDQTDSKEPVSSDKDSGDQSVDESSSEKSKSNSTQVKSAEPNGDFLNVLNADAVEVESYTDSFQGPIVALALGLAITLMLLIIVGCRLRTVKRRLRKGRALHSNEADYLINGMYL